MKQKESELVVITKAKELCQYILLITDMSPKKYRFTLVSRLQKYSLSIIEYLYRANAVNTGNGGEAMYEKRVELQKEAMVRLRLLSYVSMIAREAQCILPKQQAQISTKVVETQKLLYAWMKSDEKRRQ